MEERIVLKANKKDMRKICMQIICAGLVIPAVYLIVGIIRGNVNADMVISVVWMSFLPFVVVALWLFAGISKQELAITNIRLTGSIMLGRRIDIPLENVERAEKCLFCGVSVTTASGKVNFYMIENRKEILKALESITKSNNK